MTAKLHFGGEFTLARNGVAPIVRAGRLYVNGAGAKGLLWDDVIGYGGWTQSAGSIAANEAHARAALEFLTGKTSGMSLLIYGTGTSWGGGPGADEFGGYVRGTLGGTITRVLVTPRYTWEGYDPFDFDTVCIESMVVADFGPLVDEYLAENNASVWSMTSSTNPSPMWQRYGFHRDGLQANTGSPDFLISPAFSCAPFGAGSFRHSGYTQNNVVAVTNTMGGTSTVYGEAAGIWMAA